MTRVLVGLIDSGVDGIDRSRIVGSCRFERDTGGAVLTGEATGDPLGHGTALARILLRGCPGVRLLSAQVFTRQLSCSSQQVAAALHWLMEQDAQLINMSFGLREDRPALRKACMRAVERGIVLVAASPARGEPVFPASYPGVIRATGDARCAPQEISFLDTAQADFGAHVRSADPAAGDPAAGGAGVAGASVGCAHVSARVAHFLAGSARASPSQLRAWLAEQASYRGPERRVR